MIRLKNILAICLIISSCTNNNEKDNTKNKNQSIDTLKIINSINRQIEIIDSDTSKYFKIKRDKNDESAEGAIIVAFFKEKNIEKIEGTWFGETGKTLINYYCPNGELIFIIKKEFYYDEPIYMGQSKAKLVSENRYYFINDNLIKWISDDKVIQASSLHFSKEEKLVRKDFIKYINMFYDKK